MDYATSSDTEGYRTSSSSFVRTSVTISALGRLVSRWHFCIQRYAPQRPQPAPPHVQELESNAEQQQLQEQALVQLQLEQSQRPRRGSSNTCPPRLDFAMPAPRRPHVVQTELPHPTQLCELVPAACAERAAPPAPSTATATAANPETTRRGTALASAPLS
eukprot:CAMPEP_0203994016 /NCGR_PEP_ID=MMETSP0360-20130528/11132_1 /ASSEMBLY_ACC=CAM_ASM_000342 /TAXON_ID=268821 /ORGANISM="Scrippsiella Hangoei, Strain SHTV-5" /LENGTH=160 /DNA_ID=CAMNT_0050934543 /DNA_START=55 /DNA_END=537 /DNA_ORIENTATION=+